MTSSCDIPACWTCVCHSHRHSSSTSKGTCMHAFKHCSLCIKMRSALALLQQTAMRVRVHSQLKQKRKRQSPRMDPSGGMACLLGLAGWATWLQTCAQTARNRARRCCTPPCPLTQAINQQHFCLGDSSEKSEGSCGKATYIKHDTFDGRDLCSQ